MHYGKQPLKTYLNFAASHPPNYGVVAVDQEGGIVARLGDLIPATPAFMSAGAAIAVPTMYEKEVARGEEARIIQSPIGGIQNSKWYDYRINVNESRKELASDLRRALERHPCHGCKDREHHARWAERWWKLRREVDQVWRRLTAS